LVVDDEHKLQIFMGKRIGTEVAVDTLGDNWKGYLLKITGGHDKDGFTMKQGILIAGRTRILMSEGHATYRIRRTGERKKKSVRGCVVGPDISALALSVVKQGEGVIEGLTNEKKPRRRGPKRATRIRKLFALKKEDDPRRYVVLYSRKIEKGGKAHYKTARIQRLVTDVRLRRKRVFKNERVQGYKDTKAARAEYLKLIDNLKKKKAHNAGVKHQAEAAAKQAAAGKAGTTATKVDPKAKTAAPAKGKDAGKAPATTAKTTTQAPTKGKDAGKAPATQTKAPATQTKAPATTTKKTGK
jgi:small subunit ribosomal protein S6e